MALVLGDPSLLDRQALGLGLDPALPVVLQVGVVRGGRPLDQYVPSDAGPGKLPDVGSCLLIPEYPVVVSLRVEFPEVLYHPPPLGFVLVGASGVPPGTVPHPGI